MRPLTRQLLRIYLREHPELVKEALAIRLGGRYYTSSKYLGPKFVLGRKSGRTLQSLRGVLEGLGPRLKPFSYVEKFMKYKKL